MAFKVHPGRALLFPNSRKVKPAEPDYIGQICTPDGIQMQLVAWDVVDEERGEGLRFEIRALPSPPRYSKFRTPF